MSNSELNKILQETQNRILLNFLNEKIVKELKHERDSGNKRG